MTLSPGILKRDLAFQLDPTRFFIDPKLVLPALFVLAAAGCSSSAPAADKTENAGDAAETVTIKVGVNPTPGGEVVEHVKEQLAKEGVIVETVEYSDYPNINPSTSDGSLDANFFQHQPYLDGYNSDSGFEPGKDGYLVSAGDVLYAPLGLYSDKVSDVAEIKDGDTILIPNDATNEARALFLLQDLGLITMKDDAEFGKATILDIDNYNKDITITEIAADQLPSKLPEVTSCIVNGTYALNGGITDKLVVTEAADSVSAEKYQNVVAVKEENKDNEAIKKFVAALQSDETKDWIDEHFQGTALATR